MYKTFSKSPADERKRNVLCAVCGSPQRVRHWDWGEYVFYRCADCKLVFQFPQPVQEDLSFRYDDEYFRYEIENEQNFFNLMVLALKDIRFEDIKKSIFRRYEETSRQISDHAKKPVPRFLDIGCATGMLLGNMRDSGWDVQGVELCKASAEYARKEKKIPVFCGTLGDAGFSDSRFDVVHSSHLVEHLTDPEQFFRECFRILRPGGVLITVTPNVSGLQPCLFQSRWRSAIADHMYLFSKKTLSLLLEKTGFGVKQIRTWGGLPMGSVPDLLKRSADRAAKLLNIGDVMIIVADIPDKGSMAESDD